jgi:hypothetical protein
MDVPPAPHNDTHLVAVSAPSAKDWSATLAERTQLANILQQSP